MGPITVPASGITDSVVFLALSVHKDAAYLVSVSVTDLSDEEMEGTTCASHFDNILPHSNFHGLSPCGSYSRHA
jgi:hypothetical protein